MSRIDSIALVAAVAAGLLALTAGHNEFGYLSTIAGLALLLVLFAYDEGGYRSGLQSAAYAAVCGFCLLVACGFLFEATGLLKTFAASANAPEPHSNFNTPFGIFWLVATALFWGIDRARMSGRETVSFSPVLQPQATARSAPAAYQQTFAPVERPPVYSAPETPEYFEPPATEARDSFSAPPAFAAPPVTPPHAVPGPSGKPAEIFVNLVGEGLNVMRAVRAEHLGRDFYIIVDEMPAGENWEYRTGQVVRCRKKNLSNGKGLVAFEEAPRAQ